ncbi:glycosyltransferase [Aeromicrobium sp. P5_D10]
MEESRTEDLEAGVSVLMRTYQGVGRIEKSLLSLVAQSLDTSLFEVVVVPNGPDDGTVELLRRFREEHPQLDLRIAHSAERGVGASMNVGLAALRREYMTVIDDDDRVSDRYLEALLENAEPDIITHGYLADLEADGSGAPDFNTYVNRAVAGAPPRPVHPAQIPSSLGFNTAKLVWTPHARSVKARTNLRFATDVVYWHELVERHRLLIRVVAPERHAVYYRSVRIGSHSRPADRPYEDVVEGRLDAIAALLPFAVDKSQFLHFTAHRAWVSQARAIGQFLREHPEHHGQVIQAIAERGFPAAVYRYANRYMTRDLVTCACFLPSNNTSALVAARRVRERGLPVDVVSQDMTSIHGRDEAAMEAIVAPYLGRRKTVRSTPKFAQWKSIANFVDTGMEAIEGWEEDQEPYRSVYSRAMWPSSHVLGAAYKVRRPETRWIAEFSDPLSHDVQNAPRKGKKGSDELTHELDAALVSCGFPAPAGPALLPWIEHLAYAMADELWFTNQNQLTTMLELIEDPALRARVLERSVVSPHPTLPPAFYQISEVEYPLGPEHVHLAYFGAFYATRGLTELVDAVKTLPAESRRRLKVHIFTKDPRELTSELAAAGLGDTFVANGYAPYLDFLHLTTKFDGLIVNDARTLDTHHVNPYLPSKLSDYRGSGRPIWAIVEPGSILSQSADVAFTSELGDVDSAREVLHELIARGRVTQSAETAR